MVRPGPCLWKRRQGRLPRHAGVHCVVLRPTSAVCLAALLCALLSGVAAAQLNGDAAPDEPAIAVPQVPSGPTANNAPDRGHDNADPDDEISDADRKSKRLNYSQ